MYINIHFYCICLQSLVTPTKAGDCFSSAVLSNGNPYGIAEGLVFSMPCRSTVRTPQTYNPTESNGITSQILH